MALPHAGNCGEASRGGGAESAVRKCGVGGKTSCGNQPRTKFADWSPCQWSGHFASAGDSSVALLAGGTTETGGAPERIAEIGPAIHRSFARNCGAHAALFESRHGGNKGGRHQRINSRCGSAVGAEI